MFITMSVLLLLLLKTGPCYQSQIAKHNDKVLRKEMNHLLICQQIREWQARALKNTKAQGVRVIKGEIMGKRLWSSLVTKDT